MSLFNISTNEDLCLLLDIGNGSVTGSVVLFKDKENPKALFTSKRPINFEEKPESSNLEIKVLSFVNDILKEFSTKEIRKKFYNGRKIEKVFCIITSPWFLSRSKHLEIKNEKNFYVTERFLDDILEKEEKDFEKSIENNPALNGKAMIIENSIIHSNIRGYDLKNPIGQKTTMFDLMIYTSLAPTDFIYKIKSEIHKHIHIKEKDIIFHTFPLAVFSSLREIFKSENNYIHLDITNEITDIIFVSKNMIQKTLSIPFGKNFIIREISRALNVPNQISISYLNLFLDNKSNEDLNFKIKEVLEKNVSIWYEELKESLSSIDSNLLKSKFFITADKNISTIFTNYIKTKENDAFAINIDNEVLKNLFSTENFFDEFIAIESIFINMIRKSV